MKDIYHKHNISQKSAVYQYRKQPENPHYRNTCQKQYNRRKSQTQLKIHQEVESLVCATNTVFLAFTLNNLINYNAINSAL